MSEDRPASLTLLAVTESLVLGPRLGIPKPGWTPKSPGSASKTDTL